MRNLAASVSFFLLFLPALSFPASAQDAKKPEPARAEKPPAKVEMKPAPNQLISIEKSSKPDPCIIRPVMSDKELRDCGAQIRR